MPGVRHGGVHLLSVSCLSNLCSVPPPHPLHTKPDCQSFACQCRAQSQFCKALTAQITSITGPGEIGLRVWGWKVGAEGSGHDSGWGGWSSGVTRLTSACVTYLVVNGQYERQVFKNDYV